MGGRANSIFRTHLEFFSWCVEGPTQNQKLERTFEQFVSCLVLTCRGSLCTCRSALISLSAVEDDTMRSAKAGAWWEDAAQRGMANNSAVYTGEACVCMRG